MNYEELNRKIKSCNIPKVLFFYGEEKYLLENRVKAIKSKIVPSDLEAFNYVVLEGKGTTLEKIAEESEQFPQAADKKLIVIKNSGLFSDATKKCFKDLKKFVPDIPEYVCIIFIEEDFDKKRENILKFIDEVGGVVRFDYMPQNKIEVWAEKKLEKAGKTIIASDLTYMIRCIGTSMTDVSSSCEKLISYLGPNRHKITRDDIKAVVPVNIEVKIYDIFNKDILGGRGERAKKQIMQLKRENQPPTMIMSIIMDQLYELLQAKLLKQDGMDAKEMLVYYDRKPPIFAVNNAIENSKRYSERHLKTLLDKGLKYSMDMKTGRINQWDAVELFVSEMIKND